MCIWCLEVYVCLPGLLFIFRFETGSAPEPGAYHYGFLASPRDLAVSNSPLLGLQTLPLLLILALEDQTPLFMLVRRALYQRSHLLSQGFVFVCVVFLVCIQRWCLSGKILTHIERHGSGLRGRDLVGCLDGAPSVYHESFLLIPAGIAPCPKGMVS